MRRLERRRREIFLSSILLFCIHSNLLCTIDIKYQFPTKFSLILASTMTRKKTSTNYFTLHNFMYQYNKREPKKKKEKSLSIYCWEERVQASFFRLSLKHFFLKHCQTHSQSSSIVSSIMYSSITSPISKTAPSVSS